MKERLTSLELPDDTLKQQMRDVCTAACPGIYAQFEISDALTCRIFVEDGHYAISRGDHYTAPDGSPMVLWKDIGLEPDGTLHKTITDEPAPAEPLAPELSQDLVTAVRLGLVELTTTLEPEPIVSTRYGVNTAEELDQILVTASELAEMISLVPKPN